MDLEKYTTSKIYSFFEWSFKLIIWNLLAVSIIVMIAGTPLYFFFKDLDQKEVVSCEVVTNGIEINLKNEDSIIVNDYKIYGEIDPESVTFGNSFNQISFYCNDYYITCVNEERNIKNIDKIWFEDDILYCSYKDNVSVLGDIYNSNIDVKSCKINASNDLVIVLNNGTQINYINPFNYSQILGGILVYLAIILALFAFIPSYSTIFSLIKIYGEDGHSGTFLLFFEKLWTNFKELWKTILIIVPIISIMAFAFYMYYTIIQYNTSVPFFITFSYDFLLVAVILCFLVILNIPMTVSYFRMKTKSLIKFTIGMTFKNILYSILYLILLILPIFACLLNNVFIPIYFLLGLSLPLFIEYFVINKKYRYIVNNLKNDNTDLKELEEEAKNNNLLENKENE